MRKRYIFWRQPTGKPHRGDDDKHAPTALLARIGQSATLKAEGQVSWDILAHQQLLSVQSRAVILDPTDHELNETDSRKITWKAIISTIKKTGGGKPLSSRNLLAAADKLAALHFRKRFKDYYLITSLSLESLPAKHIKINGRTITAILGRRSRYPLPPALENTFDSRFAGHIKSTKYLPVRVATMGRTIYEATDTALNALDLLRGLWTRMATCGSWRIQGGVTKQEPIGVIHTGPVHTLHLKDGSPAEDRFWFEPDYVEDRQLFKPEKGWDKIEKDRRWVMRHMRLHPYREDVEQLLIRYVKSLDQTDPNAAFLQMWSILETITDTVGTSYKETIRRAAWLFEDREIETEHLEYLQIRRNQYVHAAKPDESDQVVYLAKSFVDHHLRQLLRNEFKVESLKEYGEFLALPRGVNILRKRRDRLNRAMRIWKKED